MLFFFSSGPSTRQSIFIDSDQEPIRFNFEVFGGRHRGSIGGSLWHTRSELLIFLVRTLTGIGSQALHYIS